MAGPVPIPAPKSDDDEDVSWALSTATALWGRGESVEALKWLRRAAETASDANRDLRAVELFKAAAELANEVGRGASLPPPADAAAVSTPPPPPVASPSSTPPPVEPVERAGTPSRRPPPPPQRRAGSLSGESQPPPAASPASVPPAPIVPAQLGPPMANVANASASASPLPRPPSIPPRSPSQAPPMPNTPPNVLTAVAPLVMPHGGRPLQNLPQRKQPIIVPPVVASASAALRRGSMPSIPAAEPRIANTGSPRDSAHDEAPTKQMTPQQAASLSRRARTASRTKGLVSLSHGGAQQKDRTRMKTERGEQRVNALDATTPTPPDPAPSAARTLKRAVPEPTEEMQSPPPDVVAAAAALSAQRRPRREDEITVVRPPFPKPDASRAAELASLAGTFDDEQTNVLGGDESFVDLDAPKSARAETTSPDAPALAVAAATPSTAEDRSVEWRSLRVGLVLEPAGPRLVAAHEASVVAFVVPADAASAEAISNFLKAHRLPTSNGRGT